MYQIVFTKQAKDDLIKLKSAGLALKARKLVDVIKENPYQNPPGYEKLVGNLTGAYSRRINIQHRLVYQVIEKPFTADGIHYKGYVKIIRNSSDRALNCYENAHKTRKECVLAPASLAKLHRTQF